MNFKKIIVVALCATGFHASALAHGELWYDMGAHVPQYGKLAVFPIVDQDGGTMCNDDADTVIFKITNHLNKKFIKQLKVKQTILLGAYLGENKKLRKDDVEIYREKLLAGFPSEEARGAAVNEVTAADGYFQPLIRDRRLEYHLSPETWVNVEMRSWTEETNGPNGDQTYDEQTWTESHMVPAKEMCLYHMDVEYDLYNRRGEKVLAYTNGEHVYSKREHGSKILKAILGTAARDYTPENYLKEMFESLVNELGDDFKIIKDEYQEEKEKSRENSPISIGFQGIDVPDNVAEDDYLLKSVYFTMKSYARKYTKANILYDNSSGKSPKYYVRGSIDEYSFDRRWIEPYITPHTETVSSKEFKWNDNGKIRTGTIKKYKTAVSDSDKHHGEWEYTATVSATFDLVDARTGNVVVRYSATEKDDKCADAYRHLMEDFYRKVNEHLKMDD